MSSSAIENVQYQTLSHGQRALWLIYHMEPENGMYNMCYAWHVHSDFDPELFRATLEDMIQRHPVWRSVFTQQDGVPVQAVYDSLLPNFDVIEADDWSDDALDDYLKNAIYEPFDLAREVSIRWRFLTRGEGKKPILLMLMHHVGTDLWSFMISLNDIRAIYAAKKHGREPELKPITQTHLDYVDWQEQLLARAKSKKMLSFWQKQLSGDLPVLNVPTDYSRPPTIQSKGDAHRFPIPEDLREGLKQYAAGIGASPAVLYLSAFEVLLYRYTGQDDILVGMPTVGRKAKFGGLIGYFVNPIVVRGRFDAHMSFEDFFKKMKFETFMQLANQDYPFPLLVEQLLHKRDASRSPIFQASYLWEAPNSFQNQTDPIVTLGDNDRELWDLDEIKLERIPLKRQLDQFDFTLKMVELPNSLHGVIEFNASLFSNDSMRRFGENLISLLSNILKTPQMRISDLPIVAESHLKRLLVEWNNTEIAFPKTRCYHALFEDQVARTPGAVAACFQDQRLSYSDLNRRANQLAGHLRSLGIGGEDLVGIYVDRSLEMLVGLLAIMKAGGAYVPLDPTFPSDRLAYMVEDSASKVILTQTRLLDLAPENNATLVCIDNHTEFEGYNPENPPADTCSTNRAYVIFTSGSTGRPKGVQLTHQTLVNFLIAMGKKPGLNEDEVLLAVTSLSFDIAGLELYLPLMKGARLVIASREITMDGVQLLRTIHNESVTLLQATPVTWWLLLEAGWKPNQRPIKMLCGGEAMPPELAKQLVQRGSLWNMYGPTETTIWSTVDQVTLADGRITIGNPIDNTQIYILDKRYQPVPVGVPGELLIGGDGLARGYMNRPDLTAQQFTPDPFHKTPGSRLYKTGDLAYYRPDGRIECLGRIDHQVKVRGYRIELGEIEAVMAKHPDIKEVVVMVREDNPGDQRIVGYYVSESEEAPSADVLRQDLKKDLPDYMVPSTFMCLDVFPLTPNGKIDRKSLPAPRELAGGTSPGVDSGRPHNEIERILAKIWCEVLGIEQVGIQDNFFDIGGTSLASAKVYAKLPELWKKDLTMVDLIKYPTIHALALYLEKDEDESTFFNKADDHMERVRLAQERIRQSSGMHIAVVGVGGRFPGADTVDEFWHNMVNGVESISFFTEEELTSAGMDPKLFKRPNFVRAQSIIKGFKDFDAKFFNFSPREAQVTDPQQRLFLECAWEALENAGYDPEKYKGSIGVYGGVGMNNYLASNLAANSSIAATMGSYALMIGNDKDFLCTRVSYKLNLTGPGVVIQTACSTSLVAIHFACEELKNGVCDMVLAGGVSLWGLNSRGYLYEEGMILSPDGHCRPFDARAKGTVPGQGAGVVVLKRLEDAIADGDHIYAVVKGTAINNDGSNKIGYTAPGAFGQTTVIQAAQAMADVNPETITYIETHGTGTPLGDPMEISCLTDAFRRQTDKKQFCAIGSAKSNFGHLDIASGVTGFIKASLSLKNKVIPPSLHYEKPNPVIDFENSPFFVNTELRDWESEDGPRRAAVSSFGIGGTNAHVILEEPPEREVQPSKKSRPWLLVNLSARSATALEKVTENFVEHLKQNPELNFPDVAYTLHVGRRDFEYRRMLVCQNLHECIIELEKRDPQRVYTGVQITPPERNVSFMFPGQGSQYIDMGQQLYQVEPYFREQVEHCWSIVKAKFPDLYNGLTEKDRYMRTEKLHETNITQLALFTTEYALARLLMHWDIKPHSMIGHSLGEYVAACLAGVFSLEDAIEVIVIRGRLMSSMPPGDMLSVRLSEEETLPLLNSEISIAAVNSPFHCVVSGNKQAIHDFLVQLTAKGVDCRRLYTSHAFHSPMMDPILDEFTETVRAVKLNPPKIPFISNVTGTWITDKQATDARYWTQHLRRSVHFSKGLEVLYDDPDRILLEIGPGRVLRTLAIRNPAKGNNHAVLTTMRHPQDEELDSFHLLTSLGRLWLKGIKINWAAYHEDKQRFRVPLPTYPFERQTYWVDPPRYDSSKQNNWDQGIDELPELPVEAEPEHYRPNVATDFVAPQDEVEKKIAEIWMQFLGLTEIGIHDDFFELGGDSLLAVRLISQLSETFEVPLATHILLQKSRISSLADYIKENSSQHRSNDDNSAETVSSPLVEIQRGNPNMMPLILVHPIGGEIYYYRDLAHNLGPEQPVYAFQAQSLVGKNEPYTDLKQQATDYTEELLRVKPDGPYLIGGSSYGGIVAYEIAQQLTQKGHKVPLLVIVDSPGPGQMPIKQEDNASILEYLLGDAMPISVEKLREMSPQEQLSYVFEEARLANRSDALPPILGLPLFNTWKSHQDAMFEYEPEPYAGRAIFFRHTEPMKTFPRHPHLPWIDLVKGGIEIHQVPGNHITMNFNEGARDISRHLKRALRVL